MERNRMNQRFNGVGYLIEKGGGDGGVFNCLSMEVEIK